MTTINEANTAYMPADRMLAHGPVALTHTDRIDFAPEMTTDFAYEIYKELERRLRINNINLSVDKVLDIAKTITTLKIKLPKSKETISKTILITSKHKLIAPLFEEKFWEDI